MTSNDHLPRPLRILVTGAGGLVGRELCRVLGARGHAVTGLLHRKPASASGTCWREGDVTVPGLGIDPLPLDVIIHCAAVTGFNLAPEVYRRVNAGGTANVLAYAGSIPLLHVSTAYVCGATEGAIAEAPHRAARFNNGYESSKAEAEALVWAARDAGQTIAVARPSIVMGRWADGRTDAFGTVYQLMRLVADGRVKVLPAAPGASLDLVPLDHVAAGLADIAERMGEAGGRVFHLASGAPVLLTTLARLAATFPLVQAPRFLGPDAFAAADLGRRERWLHEQVVDAYAAYLRPSPRFAVGNLQAIGGQPCPPIDEPFLLRMLAYAVEAGFLPGGVSGCRDSADPVPAAAQPPS